MPLKRIVFIRPGETDWNLVGRFQGWVDIPLNDYGRQQAQRLANFIRHIGLEKVYSSDHRRAKDTAEILCNALGFEPEYDERLREQHVGIWQGLTIPEMHGWYAGDYAKLQADPDNFRIPNGESRKDVKLRVEKAIKQYLKASAESEAIAIISHTTAIRFMMQHLIPDAEVWGLRFGNTSVTTLTRQSDGGWVITAANDLMHLEGMESRYMPADVRGDDR